MLFPNNYAIFQDGNSPIHTARSVESLFEEHEDVLRLFWLAQSPDLNIIKPLDSFREQGEKQIPSIISQATRRRVVQYSTRDYSGKWWPNSKLIKKCVSFTVVSIIFVHPLYVLPS
jgi:hypothetical protein